MNYDVFEGFYKSLPQELKMYLKQRFTDEDKPVQTGEVSQAMQQYLANKKPGTQQKQTPGASAAMKNYLKSK